MSKQDLIIVGGGMAGLYAAQLLAGKFNIIIIEARNELGGRIRTGKFRDGSHFEGGAEFVHGELPITLQLLKDAGLKHITAEGKMLRKEGNSWTEQDEMLEHWGRVIKLMKNQDADTTLAEFLAKDFPGEENARLRRHINQLAQGFDVADPDRVSVRSLYKEWSSEPENYRIPEGYGKLVEFMEWDCLKRGCRIIRGNAVRQVDWADGEITAYLSSGAKYRADKILITIPVSLYSDTAGPCSINFTPPIDNYIKASLRIGFGTVVKVIFKFREAFWQPGVAFVLSDEMIPTWWTQYPNDDNSLTGWAGGPIAERISQHSDKELIEIALQSLSAIFDKTPDELRTNLTDQHVFNWKSYDETKGAYSYSTPESDEAKKLLNTPLAGTVYFAGEGLHAGEHSGTVEAALLNSKQAAEKLLAEI